MMETVNTWGSVPGGCSMLMLLLVPSAIDALDAAAPGTEPQC